MRQIAQFQCLKCQTWSNSPIQFGDMATFLSTSMAGNTYQCPSCNNMVPCNKENMRFSDGKTGFVGEDTRR